MATALTDGRLYTGDAIMAMGYIIKHGSSVLHAVEPGRTWPKFQLEMVGDGQYRVIGKTAQESFAAWVEGELGHDANYAAGLSGDTGSGSSGHAASVTVSAERHRKSMRHKLRAALASWRQQSPPQEETPLEASSETPADDVV